MRLMMLMSHPFCISFKGNAERFVFSIETLDHGYLLFSYTTCSQTKTLRVNVKLQLVVSHYIPFLSFAWQKCSKYCQKRPYCQSGRAVGGEGGTEGGAGGGETVKEQGGCQNQGTRRRTQEVKNSNECLSPCTDAGCCACFCVIQTLIGFFT